MPTFLPERHDDSKDLVKPGEVLVGKYRVEHVIGTGAMGQVVVATHIQLKDRVAIKLLRPEASQFSDAEARFLREARASVKIKSEHVVRVIDVGVIESGTPAMVMEYLEGSDLRGVLREQGPLPVSVAIDYILQACEAIAEAHSLGIIHRDIKPTNLFLTIRADGMPCIKVLDFGISKVVLADAGASDAAMAKTSAPMGSPLYMSPEQLESTADVDARTDIWALGVTLYELLTGTCPFSAPTLPQLCVKVLRGDVPSMRRLRPEVSPNLEAAIGRSLMRDLRARYGNIGEFANAIAPFGSARARLSADSISRIVKSSMRGSSAVLPPQRAGFAEASPSAMTAHPEPWPSARMIDDVTTVKRPAPSVGAATAGVVPPSAASTGSSAWGTTMRRKPVPLWTWLVVGAVGGIGIALVSLVAVLQWRGERDAVTLATTASPASSQQAAPPDALSTASEVTVRPPSAVESGASPADTGAAPKDSSPARPAEASEMKVVNTASPAAPTASPAAPTASPVAPTASPAASLAAATPSVATLISTSKLPSAPSATARPAAAPQPRPQPPPPARPKNPFADQH